VADYASSPVFSSPSYWVALLVGVVGVGAAAWQERGRGSTTGSASFDRGGDPLDRAERDAFQRREAKKGKHMSRTCPSCKRPNVLSAYEAARHYQCSDCTRRDEGGYGSDY
jgi:uncharacterized protein (DUF983 family)